MASALLDAPLTPVLRYGVLGCFLFCAWDLAGGASAF
jgi:hypothetical protein